MAVWVAPSHMDPSASPSSGASASDPILPSGGASATQDGTWQPFAPSAYAPVADLVAVRSDAAGVEPQTAFRFTSRTSTPATDLADRLEVAPAVGLKVSPGSSAAEAMIQPDERLIPGTSYRFRIRSDGGAVAASWAFRTKQPLHVVATIPADRATGVPVSTGIEATFDQDDVVGYTGKVSISPAVQFELELDGRTLAVVPQRALAERTVYTVTIARGIGVHGSDVTLEQDVILRFETAGRETSAVDRVEPQEMFAESSPAEAPVIGLAPACRPEGGALDQPVVVYQLPSFDAALTAARALLSAPSWATWSDTGLVATSGLPVVLRITAHVDLGCAQGQQVVAFPAPLPAGRYLVVFPLAGRDAQVLLQVSNLALYTRVSETRTVAWVNDMATGMAVPGATITIDGKGLGSTGADGLLVVDTPRSLAVRDGSRIAPVAIARSADAATLVALQPAEWLGGASGPADAYWLAFQTDRRAFRTTDTVGAWGVIRPRAGGSASGVEVRLLAGDATVSEVAPSIVRVAVTPDANGLFAAVLPIDGLPFGTYQVALMAGGSVVTSTWIEVDEIRKPAYRIDVSLDRHVLVTGDRFTASARATYFDGTPVPGLELSFAYSTAAPVTATTDATGSAQVRLTARLGGGTGSWGPSYESVEVTPLH
ncbi:MAG TPA: Ig-like domain-containing protein, partial [Candidatus Dormibacteraeota bacterium]|nr:Ig-like domain-containing protein [Candidatus Dormibacteraeota bacterium]